LVMRCSRRADLLSEIVVEPPSGHATHTAHPVLIFAAFLMTLSFIVAPFERLLNPSLDAARAWLEFAGRLVSTHLPSSNPVRDCLSTIVGTGRLRSRILGHAFVLYGLLWIASGSLGVGRILTGRRGWLKTDRFAERPHPQPFPAVWKGRDSKLNGQMSS
jgi:hypothetical protein